MKLRTIFRDSRGRFARRHASRTLTLEVYRVKRNGRFEKLSKKKGKFSAKRKASVTKKAREAKQASWVLHALKHVSDMWPEGDIKQGKITNRSAIFKITISNEETSTRVRLTVRREKERIRTEVIKREYATDGKFHVIKKGTHHPDKSGKAPYRSRKRRC